MCFSKKKGQKKEVHSVHVHLNSHVDVVEELEFLKNNYYQNSYLKLFNELKKPESKTENPTSDNIEAQSPITGKNQLIPGNSSCLIAFQSKSDSASAERKISEIAEAGSMEQSGTSRACVEKNEQPTFDKNVNISEEVADSIRAPRIIESGAKGGAVAMVTIGRNEYFVDKNNLETKGGENRDGGCVRTGCQFVVVDYRNGDEAEELDPDGSNEEGPES